MVYVSVSASATAHASHNAWQRMAESGLGVCGRAAGVCTGTGTLVRPPRLSPTLVRHALASQLEDVLLVLLLAKRRLPEPAIAKTGSAEPGATKSQGCSRVCMQRISGECASACAIPSSNVDRGQRACRQHASGEEQREGKETRGHGFRDGQQMRTAKKGKKTTARAHDPHRRLQPFAAARLVRVDTRVGSGLQGQR